MAHVKETSDDLTPSVEVTDAFVPAAPRRRSVADYAALGVATCGVGFLPLAPGTWGSAVGVGVFLLFERLSAQVPESVRTTALLFLILAVSLAGAWAATRVEALLQVKDPGKVVVDEVSGQLIAFAFLPRGAGWWAVAAGFVAFRVFDMWKPYPVRRLEGLESGLGVMADDVLAGAYAALVVSLLISIRMIV